MRRLGKVLLIASIVLVVLVVILAAVGVWFVRRPWPQVKGTIEVAGLQAPVEVVRDEWGVPHIYAQNEHDLFFAQGYVHAQDRLWQMEFNRRIGSGTLSAALGEATLDTDRFLRTIGLRRAAEKDWAIMDEDSRAVLQAYADGVNAYITTHHGRLPLEFTIVGVEPEPWTPLDTLAWGKVMAYNLCANYDAELLRAQMIATLGEEASRELLQPYPDEGPFIVPPEVRSYAWLQGADLALPGALGTAASGSRTSWGSNSWVVHGSRTVTGLPLLANDTHLGLDMPAIWYENGLHGGRFDVVGYSFPGVPMVIMGHNRQIAWGVTNLPADVQDFYIEKLDDADRPTRYEFEGEWHDLEIVEETIQVKDGEPVVLEVAITRHGPIMNDVIGGLEDAEPLALQWTALEGTHLFMAVEGLDLAANWDDFRQALSHWDAPSQNFVYADIEGNIGYQTPGKIPVRAAGHQGMVPVPGWTGEYEWQGFIPFDELPSALNPSTGFLVTANNKVVPDDYPYHLASEWSAPYRAQRIADLLAADSQVSLEDMRDIHAQIYSLPAEALRPYMLDVEPEGEMEAQSVALLQAWDLYNEADQPGPAIYQAWYWFLVSNTLGDDLGESLMEDYWNYEEFHALVMPALMEEPGSPWFDDGTTAAVETRDDILKRSLSDAVAWLAERYGDDPQAWEWGQLHAKTFVHQPLGQCGIDLIENLFNSPTIPAQGDPFSVDAAWFDFNEPFAMTGGASQRLLVDLGNLDNSRSIQTTGQSGHLFHRHRQDFIDVWQAVDYHPLPFSQEAVDAVADATLTLTP